MSTNIFDSEKIPDFTPLQKYKNSPPVLPDELIGGVLRCGHKMLLSGSSKAGKSFLLMQLCIAIAEGKSWLGLPCKQGRVLYINLEIDDASCINRFLNIYSSLGLQKRKTSMKNIDVWNLRGCSITMDRLVQELIRRTKEKEYIAICIDPIYKLIGGEENNAADMSAFCAHLDRICAKTGCATIYCHHHSKGELGSKKAIDRASGSGVLGRDPDAILDIIQLQVQEGQADVSGWRIEACLREFKNIEPINCWFRYPIHTVDQDALSRVHAVGSARGNLAKSNKQTSVDMRRRALDEAFDKCARNGFVRIASLAQYMKLTEKTIRRYIDDFGEVYTNEKGIVTRKENSPRKGRT